MWDYDYYKQALKDIPKPCAFLNADAFQRNITEISKKSNQKKIRIASKSIRSVELLKMIQASSSIFQGIMCFTVEEALFLNQQGFNDLLIAYPVWQQDSLKKVCQRVKDKQFITLMVDSKAHIERLEQIAREVDGTFLVCVDIDLSSQFYGLHFGVHRSPIKTVEDTIAIVKRIEESEYLQLDGLMGYEAQIAGVTDHDPKQKIRSEIIRILKRKSSKELIEKRQDIIMQLRAEDVTFRFINGGGTGSLHQTAKEEQVTEITVGSGFFSPHLFDKYEHFHYLPAIGFALEITRIPKEHMYTCYGGGYIASGAVGQDKLPEVYLPAGAKLTANEGAGEVQTPIFYKGNIELKHGDPIFLRHSKAGELCERFNHIHLIKGGKVIKKVTTYRGDGQCFL